MKSNLSQILCELDPNETLSMILLQKIKEIISYFKIEILIDTTLKEKAFLLTPIDKDGELKRRIRTAIEPKFYELSQKKRDLYVVFVLAKILYHTDKNIFTSYKFHYKKNQYINTLLLSFTRSIKELYLVKDTFDLFYYIATKNIFNIRQLQRLSLHVDIKDIKLTLSDDLYRAICYQATGKLCKGLKTDYENRSFFNFPVKISVDKDDHYFDFFSFHINGYEIYNTIIDIDTFPAFYNPLYLLEPIVFKKWKKGSFVEAELREQDYSFFNHQKFIQFTLERILKVIEMLNTRDTYVSTFWIKNQQKALCEKNN